MRAVIFDMDGLLVDSEPLWVRAEIEIFGEVGVVLREEDCALTKGLRTDDVIAYWHARRPWDGRTPAEVEARLIARVATLVRDEGRALPGVADAIAVAREGGRRLALASSSPLVIIGATLERLGLADAFDVVQSAQTRAARQAASRDLPAYRRAPRGARAVECLVLEDSLTGRHRGEGCTHDVHRGAVRSSEPRCALRDRRRGRRLARRRHRPR